MEAASLIKTRGRNVPELSSDFDNFATLLLEPIKRCCCHREPYTASARPFCRSYQHYSSNLRTESGCGVRLECALDEAQQAGLIFSHNYRIPGLARARISQPRRM